MGIIYSDGKSLFFSTDKRKTVYDDLMYNPQIEVASYNLGTKFSYECALRQTVEIGSTHTYFAEIKKINVSPDVAKLEFYDLREINPIVFSDSHYFTVGEHLGEIGDYSPKK